MLFRSAELEARLNSILRRKSKVPVNVIAIIVLVAMLIVVAIDTGYRITDISTLNDKVKYLEQENIELQKKVEAMQENIDRNSDDINIIYERRAVIDEILEEMDK